jgi:hypothetical protein
LRTGEGEIPLSPFMMTQMRDPTHLSMSSVGNGQPGVSHLKCSDMDVPRGRSWEAMVSVGGLRLVQRLRVLEAVRGPAEATHQRGKADFSGDPLMFWWLDHNARPELRYNGTCHDTVIYATHSIRSSPTWEPASLPAQQRFVPPCRGSSFFVLARLPGLSPPAPFHRGLSVLESASSRPSPAVMTLCRSHGPVRSFNSIDIRVSFLKRSCYCRRRFVSASTRQSRSPL